MKNTYFKTTTETQTEKAIKELLKDLNLFARTSISEGWENSVILIAENLTGTYEIKFTKVNDDLCNIIETLVNLDWETDDDGEILDFINQNYRWF